MCIFASALNAPQTLPWNLPCLYSWPETTITQISIVAIIVHISILVRNSSQSIRKSSPRLLRASTSIKVLHPLNFRHNSFSREDLSTTQLRRYSGVSKGQSSSGEPGVPSRKARRPKHTFAGPAGRIRRTIQDLHKKWGFLIHRCEYFDDDAWERFLPSVRHEIEEHLKTMKVEDLWDTMKTTTKKTRKHLTVQLLTKSRTYSTNGSKVMRQKLILTIRCTQLCFSTQDTDTV